MRTTRSLVIVSGVTGAIGSAVLAEYGRKKNVVIYGISRQASNMRQFINRDTRKLHQRTLICSIDEVTEKSYQDFISLIDFSGFSEVIYVHALGLYPFEVDHNGNYVTENDYDGDGINDKCMFLTYTLFKTVTSKIAELTNVPLKCAIFGGLSDKHNPRAHKSWNHVIEKAKKYMMASAKKNISMLALNISSVICSHELITRPFAFINTDADHTYWLSPWEVGRKVAKELGRMEGGYCETEIFNHNPNFRNGYYNDKNFTPRKVLEIYDWEKVNEQS